MLRQLVEGSNNVDEDVRFATNRGKQQGTHSDGRGNNAAGERATSQTANAAALSSGIHEATLAFCKGASWFDVGRRRRCDDAESSRNGDKGDGELKLHLSI